MARAFTRLPSSNPVCRVNLFSSVMAALVLVYANAHLAPPGWNPRDA
jgi:hypothetical protein